MVTMPYLLYLASNSASRKKLLQQAQIPFEVIEQDADESLISTDQDLSDIVMQIAQLKMEHARIPAGKQVGQVCFVVTCDTLGLTQAGRVLCKPVDRSDAVSMLVQSRIGNKVASGFCLRTLLWDGIAWQVQQEIVDVDTADFIFNVPDFFIDWYLDTIPFLSVSGAASVEDFGAQFLQSVNGSYESIVGLPMHKICKALTQLGFYEK